ncbi:MAG: ATPase domain-containing protein [Methanoregulaceae archaeon]|jgi:KaiC/GvpD/RAD55 family RecA-like ATPase
MVSSTRLEDVPISGKPKKRSTGIVGLNLLLDGGFPTGTTIMIYGTALSGVDIAAKQFWKVEGEEGTYIMNDGDVDVGMFDATDIHPEMYLPQMAGGRIVIDSLSMIVIKYGIEEALKFLSLARQEIRKRGANMLYIVYTGVHTPVEMTRLMRAADVVIELNSETHQNEIERTLSVHKIKDAAAPSRMLPFIITDTGIEASTTSRVV